MQRVFGIPVCAEFLLHIRITKYAHFGVEFAMDAQKAAIQLQRREESESLGKTRLGAD